MPLNLQTRVGNPRLTHAEVDENWTDIQTLVNTLETNKQDSTYTPSGTGADSRTVESRLNERRSVKDFGATGDGTTDDTTAIQDAIDSFDGNGGVLYFPSGSYRTTATITINNNGIYLIGDGMIGTLTVLGKTRIVADHTSGPVIRVQKENCTIEGMTITASATRTAAAAGSNYGIQVEGEDTSSGAARVCRLERVRVTQQPSHGILLVGEVVGSSIERCVVDANAGHAYSIERGFITSRTNTTHPAGIVHIVNCRAFDNGGHGLALGHPSDTSIPSYRVRVELYEGFRNASDATFRYENFESYIVGENLYLSNCAHSGNSDAHGGIYIAGRSNKVIDGRYIDTNQPIHVGQHDAAYPTIGIEIMGMEIRGSLTFNPAITQDSGVKYVRARVKNTNQITSLMTTTEEGYEIEDDEGRRWDDWLEARHFRSAPEVTVNDDAVSTLTFTGDARGVLIIGSNTSSRKGAMVLFRVGASPTMQIIGAPSGVSVTTGALTGTTGVDGELTISTHTDNKIYVENRTGASGVYIYTLVSVYNGQLSAVA